MMKDSVNIIEAAGHILIADDDPLSLETTERMLKRMGYRCHCVPDGSAALSALEQESFDLLISDICMPGNSELQMVKKVPELAPGLPVILMTGKPTAQTAIESLQLPVMAYLVKPFKPAELEPLVKRAVEYRRLSQAGGQIFQRIGEWSRQADAMRQYLGSTANSSRLLDVNHFLVLSLGNMMNAILDIQGVMQASSAADQPAKACHLLDCPQLRSCRALAEETVKVIENSKQYIHSKELSALRRAWENFLKDEKNA